MNSIIAAPHQQGALEVGGYNYIHDAETGQTLAVDKDTDNITQQHILKMALEVPYTDAIPSDYFENSLLTSVGGHVTMLTDRQTDRQTPTLVKREFSK